MRRSPFHLLIAILCALCILGAQQAAYAHYVGHIDCTAGAATAEYGDNGDVPPYACTICTAFAGLIAAPPAFVALISVAHVAAIPILGIPTAYLPAHSAPPYTARAPPAVL